MSTDTVSPQREWKVQIKATWDRGAPIKDVVKELALPFTSCGGLAGFHESDG